MSEKFQNHDVNRSLDGEVKEMISKKVREGWADAFARYAEEGEDEMMLPDYVDLDGEIEL